MDDIAAAWEAFVRALDDLRRRNPDLALERALHFARRLTEEAELSHKSSGDVPF